MSVEQLQGLEYEALQAEKRDIIGRRIQTWNIFFGLVGATGFASVQGGNIGALVLLYPFLAFCLARYAGHSERVLSQIKDRLYTIEEEMDDEFQGYEHVNVAKSHYRKSGSQIKALRDALVLTQLAALILAAMQFYNFQFLIVGFEAVAIIGTIACLAE